MDLPQELLDEILTYIPTDDCRSFRSCSLVAKSWVRPSRRRLFETINIAGSVHLGRLLEEISPTDARMLLQHVRSITCRIDHTPDPPHGSADLLHDYSSSLCQLKRLTFHSGCPPSLSQIETYTAFRYSLSYLCLRSFRITANVVVTIANYFPNLAHLHLDTLSYMANDQPIPPFSRSLQELTIDEFTSEGLPLLDQLMGLRPHCNKCTVGRGRIPWLAQRVINGVESSVKHLDIQSKLIGVSNFKKKPATRMAECSPGIITEAGDPLTLSNCRELCELEIYASCPKSPELDLILSITSTKIQRIVFTRTPYQDNQVVRPETWAKLDNSLCRLVDRLECGLQLEVEFLVLNRTAWWRGKQGFKKRLPRSYGKGVTFGAMVGEGYPFWYPH